MANTNKRIDPLAHSKIKKIWTETFTKDTPIQNLPGREYLLTALIISVLTLIAIVVLIKANILPPEVPMLYGSPEGDAQLVNNWFLVIVPTVSLLFLFINTALVYFTKDEFLKKSLSVASLLLALMATVTTIKIIFLVGNL